MTLTTHALVGAAAAQFFPQHPVLAFGAGFISHFAIDSLPHWDYTLTSSRKHEDFLQMDMEIGKDFAWDMAKIFFDIVLGFSICALIAEVLHFPIAIALLGAAAGIVPDGLQFVYFKTRSKLLEPLQRFHHRIQEGKQRKYPAWKGISLQAGLVIVVLFVVQTIS